MCKIAVLLATFNGDKYLKAQIDSLLNQTYQNFICYIHDDGSSDTTCSIIGEYQQRFCDKIKVLDYPPTGSAKANFLSMLKFIDEKYVMFCDQDDVWIKEKIEITYQKMLCLENNCPAIPCAVFTDLSVVDEKLHLLHQSFVKYSDIDPNRTFYTQLLVENTAAGCTMMINRSLVILVSKEVEWDLSHIQMHDWWIMILASVFGRIGYIDISTVLYRQHIANQVGAKKGKHDTIRRLLYNGSAFFEGRFYQEKKEWLQSIQDTAQELDKIREMPQEIKKTVHELAHISRYPKIKRMRFYLKNRLLKRKRPLWMLLLS